VEDGGTAQVTPSTEMAGAMPHRVAIQIKRQARTAIFVLALLAPSSALAHDTWLNGYEVDPITKEICCGVDDTKLVDDLVRINANGSIWFTDHPLIIISAGRIQSSPDGHWWRSLTDDYESGITIRCVFGPYTY